MLGCGLPATLVTTLWQPAKARHPRLAANGEVDRFMGRLVWWVRSAEKISARPSIIQIVPLEVVKREEEVLLEP